MLRLWIIPLVFVCMFGAAPMQAQGSDGEIRYTVRPGDNPTTIALAFGVDVADLLALNGLDAEPILQPGQSLIIVAAQADEREEAAAPPDLEAPPGGERPLPAIAAPAPIAEADAPRFDPTRLDRGICFAMFQDDNQNGALDPGEGWLAGGRIALHDEAENETADYATEDLPFCIEDLAPKTYIIRAAAPDGYGLTAAPSLHVHLQDGGRVNAHFGLKPGLEALVVPTAAPNQIEDAAAMTDSGSLLMELSGLFVLGLAGVVLFAGLFAALLVRRIR